MGVSAPKGANFILIISVFLEISRFCELAKASVTPATAGLEVIVSTGEEFLAALSDQDVSLIGLQASITLTQEDVKPYSLPISLDSGRVLVITTAGVTHDRGGDWQTLVFGDILDLLHLRTGSELCFKYIRVKGAAPPSTAETTVEVRGSPIWPTVTGDTDHKVVFENAWLEKVQQGCTPELAAVQVGIFWRLLGRNDTISYVGSSITIADTLVAPSPLTDRLTKLQVGIAEYTYSFVVVSCKLDPAAVQPDTDPAPSPPPADVTKEVSVRSAAQLLSALSQGGANLRVTLEENIFLSGEQAQGFDLAFTRDPGSVLTITSGDPSARKALDFGQILNLLFLQPGAVVKFERIALTGGAPPSQGLASPQEVPIYVQGGTFWPTINGAPFHNVTFVDCELQRVRGNCSTESMAAKANEFQALVTPGGAVTHDGLSIAVYGSVSVPYPVFNEASQLGMATYRWTDSSMMCLADPGEGVPPSSSTSTNAGLIGGLVGGLVGGAVVIALALAAVMWHRRKKLRAVEAAGGGALSPFKSAADDRSVRSVKLAGSSGGKGSAQDLTPQSSSHLLMLPSADLEAGGTYGGRSGHGGSGDGQVSALGAQMWNTRVGVIEGLDLGELLGRGSFGRAYRGRWKGAIVAVKIVEQCIQHGKSYDLSREPLLSMSVSHPNVVMTYKLSVVCVKPNPPSITDSAKESVVGSGKEFSGGSLRAAAVGGKGSGEEGLQGGGEAGGSGSSAMARGSGGSGKIGSGGSSGGGRPPPPQPSQQQQQQQQVRALTPHNGGARGEVMVDVVSPNDTLPPGLYETWLVMEYCDRGSLTDAINSGRFLSAATRELDQVSVMLSLLDIAHGMEYLHGISMVHGDLKGRNVLLKTARIDRRGFVCKLADFGLSRMLGQEQTHVNTQSYGTATHASPELLRHGKLGPAADVYAFGIIAWEMVAGEEAYSDLTAIQILVQVSQHDLRPPIPDTCPTPLANLMQQCWATDPMDRPTFPSVVRMLSEMLRDCRRAMERARSEPVHTAAASRPSP